jgi:hypothetical protein
MYTYIRIYIQVIYVSPFPLSPDVLQYYTKLLQIQGSNERPEERFKVVRMTSH